MCKHLSHHFVFVGRFLLLDTVKTDLSFCTKQKHSSTSENIFQVFKTHYDTQVNETIKTWLQHERNNVFITIAKKKKKKHQKNKNRLFV